MERETAAYSDFALRSLLKFDKEMVSCSKANDYLFNVYAELFWRRKRGEGDSAKVKEANI